MTAREVVAEAGEVAVDRGRMGRRKDDATTRPPEDAAQREARPDERNPDSDAGSHGCE